MEWRKRVCKDQATGDVLADPAEFYYDIGKRLVLGKEEGMEVNKNVTRGLECLMRAAELGHAAANWDLQCFEGIGAELHLNFDKAAALYQKHVDLGNPMAQSNMGVCYHKGRGVEQSLDKAVVLYKAAAEQGYPRALYNLAVCYDLGEGVEADIPKAVELYNASARGGYAVAQYYMGVCYLNGKGLPEKDPKEAIEMWTRAANQGHAFAQYSLAQSYRDGTGVEKDLMKAASYFVSFTRWGDEAGWDCLKGLLSRPLDTPYFPPPPPRRSSFADILAGGVGMSVGGGMSMGSPVLPSLTRVLHSGGGYSHSAPSSPQVGHHTRALFTSPAVTTPVQPPSPPKPQEAPYYHCFAEQKKQKFEEHFHVPNLYDLCCQYFHTQWTRSLQEASAERIAEDVVMSDYNSGSSTAASPDGPEETVLPAEVWHRIKYENVYCCRPKCKNFFFGQGRVQRGFTLRKAAGGSERTSDDLVLHFCSQECASFELTPGVSAGWKEFAVVQP